MLEPSPKVTRKPVVSVNNDFKKPSFAKKKPYSKNINYIIFINV